MKINFVAQSRSDTVQYERTGAKKIKINGEEFDFSRMEEGDSLNTVFATTSPWLFGDIGLLGNQLHLALFVPVQAHFPGLGQTLSVVDIVEDGIITLPVIEYPPATQRGLPIV